MSDESVDTPEHVPEGWHRTDADWTEHEYRRVDHASLVVRRVWWNWSSGRRHASVDGVLVMRSWSTARAAMRAADQLP